MAKLSVLIPSRNERFLPQTIRDVFQKATGDVEVIVVLDGWWPDPPLADRPGLILIHRTTPQGMRPAINAAAQIATGAYLLKTDAHCLFADGFDEVLKAACAEDWIMIPRRKRLDAEAWAIQDVGKPDVDYEYLTYPDNPADYGGPSMNGRIWTERIIARQEILIDDTPASQGSCWFMPKAYFHFLELMDAAGWGPFWCESQELAFKAILSGGRYVVNKKTWYAHLHKGKTYGRGFHLDERWLKQGRNQAMRFFAGERVWHKQRYPLSSLIERFMPMPGWTAEAVDGLKRREATQWR